MTADATPRFPGPASSSDAAGRLTGALGAQYQVRRLLGRGGFAEVYEVWDAGLDRRLAVKVLRPDVAWTEGMLTRFREEARAVARLAHPNILAIHFVGEGEGLAFYAMPFIEGKTLGDVLRSRAALDVPHALRLIRPVLEALQHAHERGLVHRDIKPENVMIDDTTGRVLVMDFGIAKRLDGDKALTQAGYVVGTPHYMSPEQALGQPTIDGRSDLYSTGAMLFQMITGAPPFEGDSSQEIVAKHISEPPPAPVSRDATVPRWLSDVIVRCLAKRPDDRFRSAADVLAALSRGEVAGPSEPVAAERVARAVDTASQTTPLPAAPLPAVPGAKGYVKREGDVAVATRRLSAGQLQRRRRWRAPIAVGVLLVTAALVAAAWLRRPVLVMANPLAVPVRLVVGGQSYVVPAGDTLRLPLPRGRSLIAQWTARPPVTASGASMGVELRGSIVADRPRGTVRRAAGIGDTIPHFAPVLTNATGRDLAVTMNAGLVTERSCRCRVPSGAAALIGYYPLFSNSSVTVEDPEGRRAVFADLARFVDRNNGVVEIRVEDGDLRPP